MRVFIVFILYFLTTFSFYQAQPLSNGDQFCQGIALEKIESKRIFYILSAEKYALNNKVLEAIQSYQCIDNYQEDGDILERILNLSMQMNTLLSYESLAKKWVMIDSKNVNSLKMLILIQAKKQDITSLEEKIKKMIKEFPKENIFEFIFDKVKDKISFTQFIDLINSVEKKSPNPSGNGFAIAATLLIEKNKFHEALSYIKSAREIDLNNPKFIETQAEILWKLNKMDDAIILLKTSYNALSDDNLPLEKNNTFERTQQQLAVAKTYTDFLIQDLQYEQATEFINGLLVIYPEDIDLLKSLFIINLNLQNYDQAQKNIDQIVKINYDLGMLYQGNLYQKQKKYEEARRAYFKISQQNVPLTEIAITFLNQKSILRFNNEMELLRANYDQFVISLYFTQLSILENHGYYNEAYHLINLLLKEYPDLSQQLLIQKVYLALKLNKVEEFQEISTKMIADHPNDSNLLNTFAYAVFGEGKQEFYPQAKEMMLKAYELSPHEPAIIDSLGWMYYQLGEYEQSLFHLSIAFNRSKDPEVVFHYLAALVKNNKKEEALRLLAIFDKMYPDNLALKEFKEKYLNSNGK